MAEERITCPKCGAEIPLSEALTTKIEQRLRKSFEERAQEAEKARETEYQNALTEARKQAVAKAKEEVSLEIADVQAQLQESAEKLKEGQKRELALLKQHRQLEEAKKNLELEVERRLQEEKAQVEKAVAERVAEQHRLKDLEKEKQLTDLRNQIEDLKRKAEQGSQQVQGEVAELDLEGALKGAFPDDEILPVPKGVRGADLIQQVGSPKAGGTIVWEVKNTKAWSNAWLPKLREDQRALKADLAVIVTTALPDEVKHFGRVDDVWVTDPTTARGLGGALRAQLLEVAAARAITKGKGTKMEVLYTYLTGTEFRQRVEAVVEAFQGLQDELDRERRALESSWAKREKHITRAFSGLAGLYGDMRGIVGSPLPKVRQLELAPPGEGGGE
jgi:hypothetical protein